MFSATVMRSNRPRVLRSSVTMAIPALIAWSGWRKRTGRPSRRIVPGRRRRAGAEDRLEQLGAAGAQEPGDAQRPRRPGPRTRCRAGWAGRCPAGWAATGPRPRAIARWLDRVLARSSARRSRGRPSSARPGRARSRPRGAMATNWPSRSTVTRSARVKTSFILWLM